MLPELDNHPHARVVLKPALAPDPRASHAYLFHGPGGSGKRSAARALAAELLAAGSPDSASARARVHSGTHPDLTWITPSGAHEILVSDIDEPVVASASKTPFESNRRVFVIERVDELGDEAANRMLKTLEEPASFVHLILLTDRLGEVLPTIRSRCQLVRFDAPGLDQVAAELQREDVPADTAMACARLSLGDANRAHELASADGSALRAAAEQFARATVAAEASELRPWAELLAAVQGPRGRQPHASSSCARRPTSSYIRARSESASRPSGASGSGERAGAWRPQSLTWGSSSSHCGSPTLPISPGAQMISSAMLIAAARSKRIQDLIRDSCIGRSSWSRTRECVLN